MTCMICIGILRILPGAYLTVFKYFSQKYTLLRYYQDCRGHNYQDHLNANQICDNLNVIKPRFWENEN